MLRADLCLKNKKQFLQKRIVYLLVFTVLSGVSASVLAQPSSAIRLNATVLSAETSQSLQGASIKGTGNNFLNFSGSCRSQNAVMMI